MCDFVFVPIADKYLTEIHSYNDILHCFARVISVAISHRGLQVAYSLARALVTGRSTLRELGRNYYRKWATNQEKAWERMLKVVKALKATSLGYFVILCVFQG